MTYISFFKQEKVFSLIFLLGLVSLFRSLIIPPHGDELTYIKLSNNILEGKYYLVDNPSTVTPVVPFILAFFKIGTYSTISLVLAKTFSIILTLLGYRYLYLFLANQKISKPIILSIIALTVVNPIGIAFFSTVYPEAILFFCFWGFMYYSVTDKSKANFIKMLGYFLLMSVTRHLYLVLGLIVLFNAYEYYKVSSKQDILKLVKYSILLVLPIILWVKYVHNIEQNNLSEISYFKRFKAENNYLYNIKAGLGLIKHNEVSRINGIPAFASLFVPITGFRNYIASVILIIAFGIGYYKKNNLIGSKILIISILLIMTGLIFAGTGFSRYWLVLLPGFFLGYYFLALKLKVNEKWFVYGAQILSFVYIINELRISFLILNRHL